MMICHHNLGSRQVPGVAGPWRPLSHLILRQGRRCHPPFVGEKNETWSGVTTLLGGTQWVDVKEAGFGQSLSERKHILSLPCCTRE